MNSFLWLIRRRHPAPPLLYLEWLLLALMIVFAFGKTVLPDYWFFSTYHPAFLVSIIVLFGWTGFYLPTDQPLKQKIGFTVLEFILIFLFLMIGGFRGLFLPYLVLIIRSCLLFEMTGQLCILAITGICSFVSWHLFYTRVLSLQPDQLAQILMSFGVLFFIMFVLSLFFVLITINSLIKERNSREALAVANQKLKQYSDLIQEQSKLQERHRIARDIHDSLGHSLTGLNLQLEAALQLWKIKPETSYELISESRQLAKSSLQDVRQVVKEFRPQSSLKDSLSKLTQKVMRWRDIKVDLVFEQNHFIPTHIQTAVYRVVQEALNNIVKHSQATQVTICLKTSLLEASHILRLTIAENGQGFQIDKVSSGFGLVGMQERVQALNGTFHIQSQPEEGTSIDVTIPLLDNEL